MRQLLFSNKSENFKFFKQILKFTIFFSIISSILFCLSLKALLGQENSTYFIVWKGIEAVMSSFPPLIQLFFLFNILIIRLRLKDKGVVTLQQHRIVEAGQLTTICFDKTGTLTKDSVKIVGIQQKEFKTNSFLELQVQPNFLNQTKENNLLQLVLATCNNLSLSNNKLIGEILEKEMLLYSKMELFYHDHQKIYHQLNSEDFSYQLLKTFGFQSKLQRMSVITKDLIQDQIYLTSKGSPEQIKLLCDQETLPANYDEIMLKFNLQGYRLISLAFKEISQNEFNTCIIFIDFIINNLLDNTRDKFEQNLCFLGFLIVENNLKSDATSLISALNQMNFNLKVVSGDNIYTVLQTAKSCDIIPELQDVFVCDYNTQNQSVSINQYPKLVDKSMQSLLNNITSNTIIAMTGPFFNYILQSSYPQIHISNLILHSKIFGRMNPTMKQSLIIYLQKEKEICAMVGDGANDSQAIAAANVGIAIANTSASFSSQFIVQKLDSIIQLIQEGTALIVTNLDLFKMQTTLYFIWMTVEMFLAQIGYYFIFFHQVFAGNLPFFSFLLFPLAKPIAQLTSKKPNLNMISKQHLYYFSFLFYLYYSLSILGIMGIAALEMTIIYFYMNSSNTFSTGIQNNNYQVGGIPGTFFFGIHPLMELAEVIAFYTHNPFKEKIFKNYWLLLYLSIPFILLNIVNIFPSIAPEFIGLVTLPINQRFDFQKLSIIIQRMFIVVISNGFFLLMYCFQEIIVKKIN